MNEPMLGDNHCMAQLLTVNDAMALEVWDTERKTSWNSTHDLLSAVPVFRHEYDSDFRRRLSE